MARMRPRIVPVLVAAAALAPRAAFAANVVQVSDVNGLRTAIAEAKAGDEIVLAPGTYAISATISCNASGTAASPIVVRSATPLGAKLEVSATIGFNVTGAHWHFEDLEVKGTCAADDDCEHAFHVVGGASGFVLRRSRLVDFNAQLKVNASGGGAAIPHQGLVEGCELFDTHARQTSKPVTKLNIDTGDDWIVRANVIRDFHRASGTPTYGAFMKGGGKRGLFERNLVICSKDLTTAGTHVGLSFGGGGTAAEFCAPAFDPNVACEVEHEDGVMRNNVIAQCSDVGIYVSRGKNTKLLHNTVVATTGIDFRYATTTGEARGNVLTGAIRNRDGATHVAANNLTGIAVDTFEAMYVAPLVGDLRKKGDLSPLVGKGPMLAAVPDDYCARTRTGAWDLGALQHSLGDCSTVTPPLGTPTSPDGGASSSGGGSDPSDAGDDASRSGSSGTSGAGSSGTSGGSSAQPPSATASDGDGGCGCRAAGGRGPLAAGLCLAAIAAAAVRRRRTGR